MSDKLHIWCGHDIKPWYLNTDGIQLPWVDKVFDLETFPYPFADNTFSEIYSAHVLEHMSDLWKVMEEFTRIWKNGCQIKVIVPYFANPWTWADYTHKRWFTTATFRYFHPDFFYNHGAKIITLKYRIHFLRNRKVFLTSHRINLIPDFFINLAPKVYERFFAYIFPAAEIHYLLEVRK